MSNTYSAVCLVCGAPWHHNGANCPAAKGVFSVTAPVAQQNAAEATGESHEQAITRLTQERDEALAELARYRAGTVSRATFDVAAETAGRLESERDAAVARVGELERERDYAVAVLEVQTDRVGELEALGSAVEAMAFLQARIASHRKGVSMVDARDLAVDDVLRKYARPAEGQPDER